MRHAMVDLTRDDGRRRQARGRHLPRTAAADLGGRAARPHGHLLAVDRDRRPQAGGLYVDRPVVQDGNLITSRKPDDVPQFTAAVIAALEA